MKLTDDGQMTITAATKVTLLRFLGIPVFVLLTLYYTFGLQAGDAGGYCGYYRVGALVVFMFIALTDALDGYLARSRNEITELGRILDPLADKSLLLAAILVLTRPGLPELQPQLPIWFSCAVLSRDAILVLGAWVIHHFAGRVNVHPRMTGKIATFLQMGTVVWVLADVPDRPFPFLAATAAVFTLVSGGQYVVDGIRQLAQAPRAAHRPEGPHPV